MTYLAPEMEELLQPLRNKWKLRNCRILYDKESTHSKHYISLMKQETKLFYWILGIFFEFTEI